MLGHARITITLDIYTHLFEDARHAQDIRTRMAASPFAGLLEPTTPPPAPRAQAPLARANTSTGALGRSPNIRGLGRRPRPIEMAALLEKGGAGQYRHRTPGPRPTQQRADDRSGAPGLLLCQEAESPPREDDRANFPGPDHRISRVRCRTTWWPLSSTSSGPRIRNSTSAPRPDHGRPPTLCRQASRSRPTAVGPAIRSQRASDKMRLVW
jgi:hypothetical protein